MNSKNIGQVKISEDVISIIASLAATEVEGVAQMSGSITGNISEILGKKNHSKGVKVQVAEDKAEIDVFVHVEYGSVIPEIAKKIQDNVKTTVETMTGLEVTLVNVYIQGVTTKHEKNIETK
ncbi:Uncharacterized conserved protein YloU, alkaline shock protein (Asp23) family [Acetoanaerobium noterae]|jgi:uncharacterized alkaline shock family protein YloU|uniref:Uncharacterized conserved protein YloU, alkaline shock protein (Asp23) family n=2 Tax=root TaxID=1 RepID=A0A1T5CJ75_9FIRM|nr:Asp23/Gls24 family envelope stress response protein [Acetoanaerobium noterae]MBP8762643.1 Asp23/Gls24 family envelope stress response protein [Acetoanaerobium sp.]MDK2803548.1 hypothetical protein [Peptostreptococcaceae bacterium]MBP9499652.1 Asp23/Gls24 family envelope stress response protein [Acetoanaerobium sp.]MBP9561870.1 Asp23/Gls24 family envelope stress response protein [Acetoanaerobium sp.]SKB59517.1 Uncharacterized conserved protein YloU, alkaline shock protein (Asp23) family [Ace